MTTGDSCYEIIGSRFIDTRKKLWVYNCLHYLPHWAIELNCKEVLRKTNGLERVLLFGQFCLLK